MLELLLILLCLRLLAARRGKSAHVPAGLHGGQALRERFPKVQQITCITIHINMYGDTGVIFWRLGYSNPAVF